MELCNIKQFIVSVYTLLEPATGPLYVLELYVNNNTERTLQTPRTLQSLFRKTIEPLITVVLHAGKTSVITCAPS
jgi:hypothetical protein